MIFRYTYKNIFWLDIEAPSPAEHVALLEEGLPRSFLSLADAAPSLIDDAQIILTLSEFDAMGTYAPIRLLINQKGLYTYHMRELSNRHAFANMFSADSMLEKDVRDELISAKLLLYFMQTKIETLASALHAKTASLALIEKELFFWQELLLYFQNAAHVLLPASTALHELSLSIQHLIFLAREEELRIATVARERTIWKLRRKVTLSRYIFVGLAVLAFIIIFVMLKSFYGHYSL